MAPSNVKQTLQGKAFEYACLKAIADCHSNVCIVESDPLCTARDSFNQLDRKLQEKMMEGGIAAAKVLDHNEPNMADNAPGGPLQLLIQPDSAGIMGDVRDILCQKEEWEIGISCKHNHRAVKHSRLSNTIDFGKEWIDHPCSKKYFDEIGPIFTRLKEMRSNAEKENRETPKWSQLANKEEEYYKPVLLSFLEELRRINSQFRDVPEKLVRYLLGTKDFYKVITEEPFQRTRVEAFNINGTLGQKRSNNRANYGKISIIKMPTRFYYMGFKEDNNKQSNSTLELVCDRGWQISMRIHNASELIEPSLKFDVQLVSSPATLDSETVWWGSADLDRVRKERD